MIAVGGNNNNRLLNEIVDAFETHRAQNATTDIDSFLPDRNDPEYSRIALELMRVDMEHSWRDGSPKSLEEYKSRFTEVLSDQAVFRELAYEDYRQRLQNGETIRRDDYRRFGLDPDGWPDETNQDADSTDFGTVQNLTGEFSRLVESIQEYPSEKQAFGPYDIVEQIGQGAFARVYLARQRELADRLVVLKVGSLASTEHERLARLQHTNIVPIYSAHDVDSVSVICMPFFGLSTLADVLSFVRRTEMPPQSAATIPRALADKRTAGPACTTGPDGASAFSLSEKSATDQSYESACVSIMHRVADALRHANDRGILHRDLKPANILLSDDGQPMLLDFNVSGDVVPGGTTCLSVGGTLPYMSPEQLRAIRTGETNDARSDIYSFGVVFYELLTGTHPFSSHRMGAVSTVQAVRKPESSDDRDISVADNVERAVSERESFRPRLREQNPSISMGLANIVNKCLQPDPANRYSCAAELFEDLDRHQNDLPVRFAKCDPVGERFQKWCRRHPKLMSGTVVASAAVVLLLAISALAISKIRDVGNKNAIIAANKVRQELPQIRALLTTPDRDEKTLNQGKKRAGEMLQLASKLDYSSRLARDVRDEVNSDVAELEFLLDHVEQGPATSSQIDIDAYRLMTMNAERRDILTAVHEFLVGRAENAIPTLERVVRREPLSVAHRQVLANAYVAAGRISQADEAYSVCVSIDPTSFLSVFNRGLCRLEAGRYSEAIGDFSLASELRPTSVEALINRGLAYKGNQDYENAERDLSEAIRRKPDWSRPFFIRSRVRKAIKDSDGATEDVARGLELTPITDKDWIARGIALLKTDPDAAYACFEEALRLNPLSRSALRNMAHVISEHRRDADNALGMLDRIVEISPGYLDDVVSRCVLHARLGKTSEAIAEIETVLAKRRDGKTVIQAACVYALAAADRVGKGNADLEKNMYVDRAVSLVGEAITMDPRWLSVATRDPDLSAIRGERKFKSIISAATRLQQAVRDARRQIEPDK